MSLQCLLPIRLAHRAARTCLAAAFLVAGALSAAQAEPQWTAPAEVSQGRAFVVRVYDNAPSQEGIPRVSVSWRGKTVPLTVIPAKASGWEAEGLLAVPMDAKGSLPLTIQVDQQAHQLAVRALPVPWHEDRITVAPKYVTPPPEVLAQIERDREHVNNALAASGPERAWTLPFYRPVKGSISGPFGGRRVLNGKPRSPHKGTDMRGPQGTPVHAVAAGKVLLAEPQYYSGNVIYVDHGQGVVSMYGHLSAFDVKPGDTVERGQVIGKVGATGRVTGPHLHLGLLIQGVAVDAMPLYAQPLQVVGGPTPEDKVARAAAPTTQSAPAKAAAPRKQP